MSTTSTPTLDEGAFFAGLYAFADAHPDEDHASFPTEDDGDLLRLFLAHAVEALGVRAVLLDVVDLVHLPTSREALRRQVRALVPDPEDHPD